MSVTFIQMLRLLSPSKAIFFLIIVGLATPLSTQAAARSYQVDLIIFEYINPNTEQELWPETVQRPDVNGAVHFGHNERPAFYEVRPNGHKLGGIWSTLEKSTEIRPLHYVSWIQPAYSRSRKIPVRISNGVQIATYQPPRLYDDHNQSSTFTDYSMQPVYQIDGTVNITISRYVHLDTHLIFSEIDPAGDFSGGSFSTSPAIVQYPLQENRRMKSSEINYLDHPRFGVIAYVSRRED